MTKQITLDELEKYLWQAAVDLRGQIDASAYKDYIFPLVFFKRICDVRDEEYQGYEAEGGKEYADMMIPMHGRNIFINRLLFPIWKYTSAGKYDRMICADQNIERRYRI